MSEMKASRELDALVAEKVMGWTPPTHDPKHTFSYRELWTDEHGDFCQLPRFTERIDDAWMVVEKMAEGMDGPIINLAWCENPDIEGWYGWVCDMKGVGVWQAAAADTAPLAICKAALKAKGVEVPDA